VTVGQLQGKLPRIVSTNDPTGFRTQSTSLEATKTVFSLCSSHANEDSTAIHHRCFNGPFMINPPEHNYTVRISDFRNRCVYQNTYVSRFVPEPLLQVVRVYFCILKAPAQIPQFRSDWNPSCPFVFLANHDQAKHLRALSKVIVHTISSTCSKQERKLPPASLDDYVLSVGILLTFAHPPMIREFLHHD
jgi:hypothetical protein